MSEMREKDENNRVIVKNELKEANYSINGIFTHTHAGWTHPIIFIHVNNTY